MLRSLFVSLVLSSPVVFGAEWKILETEDFTVNLPGLARKTETVDPDSAGSVKTTIWGVQTNDAFFAISTADYPTGLNAEMLEDVRDGAMASVGGTVEKDIAVALDSGIAKRKHPGREFDGTTKNGLKLAARLFVVDNRLYQLICVSRKAGYDAKAFKKFADSFKLKVLPQSKR